MADPRVRHWTGRVTRAVLVMVILQSLGATAIARARIDAPDPEQLIGLWRGTSTCTDRVAAPACQDERVVYEFTAGTQPEMVHWAADKIVNGRRARMGEMDVTYDKAEACWKAEFSSPRLKSIWRIVVDRDHMTGSARLLPGNEMIRKIELRRDRSDKPR
jgi:hypothetical protein